MCHEIEHVKIRILYSIPPINSKFESEIECGPDVISRSRTDHGDTRDASGAYTRRRQLGSACQCASAGELRNSGWPTADDGGLIACRAAPNKLPLAARRQVASGAPECHVDCGGPGSAARCLLGRRNGML